MYVVSGKSAHPDPVSSLDDALMHAFGVWSDLKVRNSMTEPSSPKTFQAEADSDSLRRKLRDSLTSALEMVVSKQLVKSVLGKAVEVDFTEEKLITQSRWKTEGDVTGDPSTDDIVKLLDGKVPRLDHPSGGNLIVSMHVDTGIGPNADDSQSHLLNSTTAEQSHGFDHHSDDSPIEDFEKEAIVKVVEEAKGGIQLMEQARKVAWDVELNLFSLNGGVNKKYKEKARSLLFNLKDKSNPELRARVFKGDIHPEILVSMSAAELASKELCEWRIAKAEEFASMVVVTEAETDPRRIVKKTHKGEFEVVVEDIRVSTGEESTVVRPAFPANDRVRTDDKEGDAISGRIGRSCVTRESSSNASLEDRQIDRQALSQISVLRKTVEDENMEREKLANDILNDLPSSTSRDQDIHWHRETEVKGSSHANVSCQEGELETVPALRLERRGDETSIQPSASDPALLKLCKGPSSSFSEPKSGNGVQFSKRRERDRGSSVWEGTLQLSSSRFVAIGGFYKSGARLQLTDWPQSVEVKGRVRLGVLDKFLRDLQLSRSRSVTVLSLCPSDGQSDGKRMGAFLKEIADNYRIGDRAGFAEPRPGFELYLLAPGSACLDLLSEDLKTQEEAQEEALDRGDEALVGVVVWRRFMSPGLSSNRGPKQSNSIRKDTLSNLVCDSPTARNAQSLHRKEIPTSRGGVSASVFAASALSLVDVRRNMPIHSSQSVGGSSDTMFRQTLRQYEHVSPGAIGGPLNSVTENSSAMAGSSLLPQWSRDLEDLPPGFVPQTKTGVPQAIPAVLNVQMLPHAQDFRGSPSRRLPRVQDFQGSPSHMGSLPARVRDGNRDIFAKAPSGFWLKAPAEFPMGALHEIHTVLQQEDDDLPEFNFDTEGGADRNPANHVNQASKPVFFSGHDSDGACQSGTGVQHISDPCNVYLAHHDVRLDQPSSIDFQSLLNGLPLRHLSEQEESSAPQSVSFIPSNEDRNNGVFAREILHTTTQTISRSMFLLGSTDTQNLSNRATEDPRTCEKLWDEGHHLSGIRGPSTIMSSGSTSSGDTTLNGASHTVRRGFLQTSCLPPMIRQLGWPGLPPTLSGYPQHDSQRPPLSNRVIQHRQIETKNSVVSSAGRLPLLHQDVRRHEWPAIGAKDASEMSLSHFEQVCSKRKTGSMEINSGKVRASDFNVNYTRHSRTQSRPRDFLWEPSLASTTQRELKRWGRRKICPARARSLVSDVEGDPMPKNELRVIELPKRERERDQ